MRVKDFKKDALVKVASNSYGYFKTLELIPRTSGPQLVKVLHSSDDNFDFALIKTYKLSELTFI
jgi:hypothetical protein